MHVIATAGHVDHGKSTLVRALTGMEPDRWAEEQRRGMTIDLGYAWMSLPDGSQLAFVDVPGHHRFITNMLAGVGPVPAVLLVVAADEGWCRQTTEHLAALNALGVRHGLLAVTRSDLGDADLAIEEARDHLAGSSLAAIDAIAVSPITGEGIAELYTALAQLAVALPPPAPAPTRLWIDRVFSIRGAGTIVTGTLGKWRDCGRRRAAGYSVQRARPGSGPGVPDESVESASAVARVAVNLRGVKPDALKRGDALVAAGRWAEVRSIDVRLLGATERLPSQLMLHAGSAAVPVRVRELGGDHARLTLSSPLPLHVGERALVRNPGTQHVAAGLIILDTDPPSLARRGAVPARARELEAMSGIPDASAEVTRRGVVRRSDLLAAGVLAGPDEVPPTSVSAGDWLIDERRLATWARSLGAAVDTWASSHPTKPGMPRAAAVPPACTA